MIDYLNGNIKKVDKHTITLETHFIAFCMQVPDGYIFQLNTSVIVFTYMYWNQENGPQLFGFSNELDRTVFLLIINCSGIGPKIALALLAHMGSSLFIKAIHNGDQLALAAVSGIGTKKAEHIVIGLKHKIAKLVESGIEIGDTQGLMQWHQITQALESLNYSKIEIGYAVNQLKTMSLKPDITFDQLLRKALSYLTKQ